jgi:hypothetical protein
MQILKFQTVGFPVTVKIVRQGETFGQKGCLVHDRDEPLVEFYDARYAGKEGFDPEGQFISRYYVGTILERPHTGLDLYGGEPQWKVCADDMELVKLWLRQRLANDMSDPALLSSSRLLSVQHLADVLREPGAQ